MSSIMRLFIVFSLFIPAVKPEEAWDLKCPPAVGIVAQTTVIRCDFISNAGIKDIKILAVTLRKSTQEEFIFIKEDNAESTGDKRISLENPANSPSLKITNTAFSDEGEYVYRVITNKGAKNAKFSIRITATYKDPKINTWPKDVSDRSPVTLYCNATEGYPAGFIHWFDRSGFNWTRNAELTNVTNNTNGLKSVALYSKLTFTSVMLDQAPFRCVVLNSKYEKDGENAIEMSSALSGPDKAHGSNTTHIIAGVMVIGSLIVGLLFALLFFRRRNLHSYEAGNTADPETPVSPES